MPPTKPRKESIRRLAARLTNPAHVARVAELESARRAIGPTLASRLAWVVRFVAEDPTTWHPAVRIAYGDCLHMLVFGIVNHDNVPDPMAPDEVEALHRDLRSTLRDLLGKNPTRAQMVDIPTEGQSEGLIRLTHAGKKPAMFATSHGQASVRTAVFQAVKDLILQAGERLLACPACGAPFISARKQAYCTPRCSQRTRNQKRTDKRPRKTALRKGGE